jgi:HK97 family phage major capsid protein
LDASLTHIPAEPRNTVIPLKSLSDTLPPFPEQEAEPEADSDGGEVEVKEISEPINLQPLQEDQIMDEEKKSITMTEDELDALVQKSVTEAVKALPANDPPKAKSKADVTITIDEADRPFKSAGEFYIAVADKARGRASDVRLKSLKVPDDEGYFVRSVKAEPTGLGEEQPVYGGYLVGTDQPAGLVERMYQDGEVLNRVSWTNISANANGIVLNGLDETDRDDSTRWGGVLGYWVAEAGSLTATKPAFRQIQLRLNKVAAAVYMTDELLADAAAVESWVNQVAPAELRFKVEDAIINGSGAGKPKGILSDSGIYVSITAETGQASTTLLYENVVNMWSRMWAPSRRSAVWYINQDIEPELFTMSLPIGTAGVPVYLPAGGASGLPYGTLFGRPVIPIEYAQTLGTLGDIIFADMSSYIGIRKGGIQAASSMHVQFLYDEMVYRFIYRVDGQPLWHSSLTPKNSSNTQSTFCVVASR